MFEIVMVRYASGTYNSLESSFQTLEEYMREKYVYQLLRKINFFKFYLNQKAINIWKRYVGMIKFHRIKQRLVKGFFHSKPQFIKGLLTAYSYIYELTELPIVYVTQNHLHQLDEFSHSQSDLQRHSAIPTIEAICDKIQKVVSGVCNEAKRQALIYKVQMLNSFSTSKMFGSSDEWNYKK